MKRWFALLVFSGLVLSACRTPRYVPQGRPYATVIFATGEEAIGQVKLREANLYEMTIVTQNPGPEVTRTRQRFQAAEVLTIQFEDQTWESVLWSDHMGVRKIFMRNVSPGLRYTVYKELQCRCNNSFRSRRAFILPDGTVIRKQIFGDRPADPVPSGRKIKFSEIPTEVK